MHNCERKKRNVGKKKRGWRWTIAIDDEAEENNKKVVTMMTRSAYTRDAGGIFFLEEVETSGVKWFWCWLLSKFHIRAVQWNDMNLQLCGWKLDSKLKFWLQLMRIDLEVNSLRNEMKNESRNMYARIQFMKRDLNWRINAEISQQ